MKEKPASQYESFFWNLWKKDPQNKSLLLEYKFLIEGNLDINKLKSSLEFYFENYHSDAHYAFVEDRGNLIKKPRNVKLNFLFEDLSDKKNQKNIKDLKVSPKANLYQFKLTKNTDMQYTLHACFSHIIFDGYSYRNFIKKIQLLYNTDAKKWKKIYN